MSYRDEYYDRTEEQERRIFKERERSWNVLRFFVAFPVFSGVLVLLNRWFRTMVEPSIMSTPTNQTVLRLDSTCALFPILLIALFLCAAMMRAIARSNRDIKHLKPNPVPVKVQPVPDLPAIASKTSKAEQEKRSRDETQLLREQYARERAEERARIAQMRAEQRALAIKHRQEREDQKRIDDALKIKDEGQRGEALRQIQLEQLARINGAQS